MEWIKEDTTNSIEDVVTKNTNMSIEQLLNDEHEYVYPNLFAAAEMFLTHIKRGSKVVVYGDYDADGITSLSELTLLCRALKFDGVSFVAPRRFSDGYGLNVSRVKDFISEGFNLIVTIDNGIAAHEAILTAKRAGLDVIVLDHHMPLIKDDSVILPEADIICDPHVTGGDSVFNFDDLCGAGIGLKFCEYVLSKYNNISDEEKEDLLCKLYSLAAIGTVADVVDLTFNNRQIVKRGLEYLNNRKSTVGVNELLNVFGVEHVDSSTIGFTIAPAINAMGRLYDTGAAEVVVLLTCEAESDMLNDLCQAVKNTNEIRKNKTQEIVNKAMSSIKISFDTRFIVYFDNSNLVGIAGLIAAKLADEYKLPSICLMKTLDDNKNVILKGSGRTFGDVDILSVVRTQSDLLTSYGGHPQALGLSLKAENLEKFISGVNENCPNVYYEDKIHYDLEFTASKSLWNVVNELDRFEPFGEGNPRPIICISDIVLGDKLGNKERYMGKNNEHVKLINENLSVVWFNKAKEYKVLGGAKTVSAIGNLSVNVFKGRRSLQLQAMDVIKS